MTSTQASISVIVPKEYRSLPTHELIEKIVNDSDTAALECFLTERRIFRYRDKRLNLPEYLNQLRENQVRKEKETSEVAGMAYDRAYTKFISLPGTPYEIREDTKRSPVDCRRYYQAFLKAFRQNAETSALGEVDKEQLTSTLLGRHVWKHFRLSYIDAQRIHDPAGRRYQWKTSQGTFNLRIPKSISTRKTREWLEEHFLQDVRKEPLEQKTIQAEIEKRFQFPEHINTENLPLTTDNRDKLIDAIDGLHHRLETAVIQEKLRNFDHLRPKLRKLGREKLPILIQTCLRHLTDETFNLRQIAKQFDIPLATMSEIAGPHWYEHENPNIPDIWQNVGVVISHDPLFHDAKKTAGISDEEIIETLTGIPSRKDRKT